jgi:hypothetical protein
LLAVPSKDPLIAEENVFTPPIVWFPAVITKVALPPASGIEYVLAAFVVYARVALLACVPTTMSRIVTFPETERSPVDGWNVNLLFDTLTVVTLPDVSARKATKCVAVLAVSLVVVAYDAMPVRSDPSPRNFAARTSPLTSNG